MGVSRVPTQHTSHTQHYYLGLGVWELVSLPRYHEDYSGLQFDLYHL